MSFSKGNLPVPFEGESFIPIFSDFDKELYPGLIKGRGKKPEIFFAVAQASARGRVPAESIGPSDFGFGVPFLNPQSGTGMFHSVIRNPQLKGPPGPGREKRIGAPFAVDPLTSFPYT